MVGDGQIYDVLRLLDELDEQSDEQPELEPVELATGMPMSEPLEDMGVPPQNAYGKQALPAGIFDRCPTCGGKVIMPCRECEVLSLKERQKGRILCDD